MSPKSQPIGQGDFAQVAGSSAGIRMAEANSGTDASIDPQGQAVGGMLDATAGRDVQHQVQTGVALSPDKATLKSEVSQLRDHSFFCTRVGREQCEGLKVSAMDKAKALLADQRAGYQQSACEHEAVAQDICEAEVAQTRAFIVGEAVSVISQKDAQLSEAASSLHGFAQG